MKKLLLIPVIVFLQIMIYSCSDHPSRDSMPKASLRKTTDRTIELIRQKNYVGFREMFAEETKKDVMPEQMNRLVDKIAAFLAVKEMPDEENIVSESGNYPYKKDSVYVTNLKYIFDNPAHSLHSYSRAITFTFMKKYGPEKLAGLHILTD